MHGTPFRATTLDVELDIADEREKKNKMPRFIKIRLLFVRGAAEGEKPCVGKKYWALFLTTDPNMSQSRALDIYALRWGNDLSLCDTRARVQDQMTSLNSAKNLWRLYRVLILGALDGISRELEGTEDIVMGAIDNHIHDFFVKSLQLDALTLEMEFE